MNLLTFLAAPGAAYFIAAFGCAMMAMLGLMMRERRQVAAAGIRLMPTGGDISRRYMVGNLAGIPLAAILLVVVTVGNIQGQPRLLLLFGALAIYLYLAVVLPRKPLVQLQKEAAELRAITPGFISFIRVALSSFESPMDALRRYIARPLPHLALMQGLVEEAIQLCMEQRHRPFAALSIVARQRACRELTDMADALAQAEAEGGSIESVLAAQQATLELILQSEFKRMLRRRTMYLLLMVAVSLVIGILLNLLWVMTGGGAAFNSI
jgi:archaellum biogenesis protein FlaJ (TadC family)